MANALSTLFTDIATAIRSKTGDTEKLSPADFPGKIQSIENSSSDYIVEKRVITVIDYDGTLIEETEVATGEIYVLPNPPEHERLVFDGWVTAIDVVDGTITIEDYDLIVGPMYHTLSGATELDFVLTEETGLTITLSDILTGLTHIDWGDNVENSEFSHTYADYGEYTVKLYGVTSFDSTSTSSKLISTTTVNSYGLKRIHFSESVMNIGNYCFYSCSNLKSVSFSKYISAITGQCFRACSSLEAFVIPNSVTSSLSDYIYMDCVNLKYLVIPTSITSIGSIFGNKHLIEKLIFPDSITIDTSSMTTCGYLKYVRLSKNINNINSHKFMNCNLIKKIIIPSEVESIGENAFGYCYHLEEITIPQKVSTFGITAFQRCYSLKSVILDCSISVITKSMFSECNSLQRIVLPSTIDTINEYAFNNCYSCMEYDFSKCLTIPTLSNTNAFTGINKLSKIKVSSTLYDKWITANNWSTYSQYIVAV